MLETRNDIKIGESRGGEEHYRYTLGFGVILDLPANLKTIYVGQVDVEEDQIRWPFSNREERLLAGARLFDQESGARQDPRTSVPARVMIIDVEDSGRLHRVLREKNTILCSR